MQQKAARNGASGYRFYCIGFWFFLFATVLLLVLIWVIFQFEATNASTPQPSPSTKNESCYYYNKTGSGDICFQGIRNISNYCVHKELCPVDVTPRSTPCSESWTGVQLGSEIVLYFVIGSICISCPIAVMFIILHFVNHVTNEQARTTRGIVNNQLFLAKEIHEREMEHVHNPLEQKQFNIPSSDLHLGEKIGSGGCGWIFEATLGPSTIVAAKEIISTTINPDNLQEFEHEARMLTQMNHPCVLRVLGFCIKPPKENKDNQERRYIVTEFAPNGSLESVVAGAEKISDILQQTESGAIKDMLQLPFTKTQALEWALQVASGMEYLHRKGYVHRDMKPQNVLLNKSNDALVADLGTVRRPASNAFPVDVCVVQNEEDEQVATGEEKGEKGEEKEKKTGFTDQDNERNITNFCKKIIGKHGNGSAKKGLVTMRTVHGMTEMIGTPLYMAPEQFRSPDYSYPVDVWAYGVTLVRLFTLKWPYPSDIYYTQLILGIARGQLRPIQVQETDVPDPDVLNIINECLSHKPALRPTFKVIEKRLNKALIRCLKKEMDNDEAR